MGLPPSIDIVKVEGVVTTSGPIETETNMLTQGNFLINKDKRRSSAADMMLKRMSINLIGTP